MKSNDKYKEREEGDIMVSALRVLQLQVIQRYLFLSNSIMNADFVVQGR